MLDHGAGAGARRMPGGWRRGTATAGGSVLALLLGGAQYRFPLAYGGQRTPTAQWTATAAGAVVLGEGQSRPSCAKRDNAAVLGKQGDGHICITHALFGKMVEMGVTDANNMGAAMAPAAYNTLSTLLADLGAQPQDFDCIVTGDLGHVGADLLLTLLREDRIDLSPVYSDCGSLLFGDEQDAHAGGSGCGCSAAVLCGPLLRDMQAGKTNVWCSRVRAR